MIGQCFTQNTQQSIHAKQRFGNGGAMRDRTADLLDANQALSQLSYGPVSFRLAIMLQCFVARKNSISHIPLRYAPSIVSRAPCPESFWTALLISRNAYFKHFLGFGVLTRRRRGSIQQYATKPTTQFRATKWWVWVDLNYRPHPYQGCAPNQLSYRPSIRLIALTSPLKKPANAGKQSIFVFHYQANSICVSTHT